MIISVRLRLVGSVGGHPGRGRGGCGGGLAAPAATANYSFSGEWSERGEQGKEIEGRILIRRRRQNALTDEADNQFPLNQQNTLLCRALMETGEE